MSYINAEEVLPKELINIIQQYVSGKAIYIPSVDKKPWGSQTDTRQYLHKRNVKIYIEYKEGASIDELAKDYALSDRSIKRIIRDIKKMQLDVYNIDL